MNSKIEKELSDAAEIDPKRGEDRQDWLLRLSVGVSKLPDAEWEKLSPEAQDWMNEAADYIEKKTDIADFPDLPKEEATTTRRRTTGAAKAYEPAEKDDVKVTTKRGKLITGKIVELTKDLLVLKKTDGDEEELSRDRIESIEPLAGGADKDEGPKDPEVGDAVTLETVRGKTVSGELVELTEELIVLRVNGEEQEFTKERVKSIKVDKPAAKADTSTRRRGAAAEPEKETKEPATEGKRTRSTNGGVSVGTRIREIVIGDQSLTEAAVGEILKKEKIECRENTLSINYADTHKVLAILKEKKLLK